MTSSHRPTDGPVISSLRKSIKRLIEMYEESQSEETLFWLALDYVVICLILTVIIVS